MSSSSATATTSRSPSPATPESSDSPHNPISIQNNDADLSSWYNALDHDRPSPNDNSWENDGDAYMGVGKSEEQPMLHFDDLIEEHAYEDSPYSGFDPASMFSSSAEPKPSSNAHSPILQTPTQSMHASDLLVPASVPISSTKPIPPPAARPRKKDSFAAGQRVVYPPKDSCYNLPIMVPSIPEGGTKSRVETQVRVTVDLAHASSSSGEPFKYDRVGSWKWLKLPTGTATKKRTRKEGKIDPIPQEMLYLTATVSCASPPHNPVLSCGSCQAREAKRVARKLAARVRPARSDSDSPDGSNPTPRIKEDTTSIVQFNCPEVLDFSSGTVVLPLRITCYCRHHREKVGFHVHFGMMDHTGRIVGNGTSRPIMITDDHKTVNANKGSTAQESDIDWSQFGKSPSAAELAAGGDVKAPSKRKQLKEVGQAKRRSKPYDASSRTTSARVSREASVVSLSSLTGGGPSTPHTRATTPAHYFSPRGMSQIPDSFGPQQQQPQQMLDETAGMVVPPSDTIQLHPPDQMPNFDMSGPTVQQQLPETVDPLSGASSPSSQYAPNGIPLLPSAQMISGVMPPLPYMFFDPSSPPPITSLPAPKIHRLIPATGPTYGGIEVTILGANFHPAMTLSCVFGDVVASSTQRWSDNTLVCVLPPRPTPGVVAVWFDGVPKDNDPSPPCLFTYTDESDRALMELALQVVGLKMTGKIEEAKNVAMRIVGSSSGDDSQGGGDASNMMQLASASYRDIRPMLLTRAGDGEDFESVIVDFLSVLEVSVDQSSTPISSAVSLATPSGQTMLHLAAMLGFSDLIRTLIRYDIDLDARDRNGYTALHYATLAKSKECAKLLIDSGADLEVVNALGKTPQEQASFGFFEDIISERSDDSGDEEDEESRWGDAEEDEDELLIVSRRSIARPSRRRTSTPTTEAKPSVEDAPPYSTDEKRLVGPPVDKQAASLVEMIQRTLGQLHAPQGIIPNMPQLPLPALPEMWGALPQIPVMFPVFVPTPGWPTFRGEKSDDGANSEKELTQSDGEATGYAIRTAQEWRATCEKWMTLALAAATLRQEEAPPVYTPRTTTNEPQLKTPAAPQSELEDEGESSSATVRPLATTERPVTRRFGYPSVPITEQDVNAYGYRPSKLQSQKLQKKNDRMLVYFWIPILILSLIYALYTGVRLGFDTLKTVLPLNGLIQV